MTTNQVVFGLRVGLDPCAAREGELADQAAPIGVDDLAGQPGRARRAVRPSMPDAEPADLDGHAARRVWARVSAGGAGLRSAARRGASGSSPRGRRTSASCSSARGRAGPRARRRIGGNRRNRIQTSVPMPMNCGEQDEEEVEDEERLDDEQAERDQPGPPQPLPHVDVGRVPVERPRPDVCRGRARTTSRTERRDPRRVEEVREVRAVEREEQVVPGGERHALTSSACVC